MTALSLFHSSEKASKSALPPRKALALSLLLHALVLAALSDLPSLVSHGVAPQARLQVSVKLARLAAHAEQGSVASKPSTASRRHGTQAQPLRAEEPRQRAAPPAPGLTTRSAADAPPAPAIATGDIPRPAPAAAAGGIPRPAPLDAPASVAVASSDEVPALDAAGLREYRLSLASEARRVRNYPEAARRAGLGGVAEIRVIVNAFAQPHTELARSSGYALLDEAALNMLRLAAERTAVPLSLRGQDFAVLLPVVFEIRDTSGEAE